MQKEEQNKKEEEENDEEKDENSSDDDDDGEGWINQDNLKNYLNDCKVIDKFENKIDVYVLTTDFAMQVQKKSLIQKKKKKMIFK